MNSRFLHSGHLIAVAVARGDYYHKYSIYPIILVVSGILIGSLSISQAEDQKIERFEWPLPAPSLTEIRNGRKGSDVFRKIKDRPELVNSDLIIIGPEWRYFLTRKDGKFTVRSEKDYIGTSQILEGIVDSGIGEKLIEIWTTWLKHARYRPVNDLEGYWMHGFVRTLGGEIYEGSQIVPYPAEVPKKEGFNIRMERAAMRAVVIAAKEHEVANPRVDGPKVDSTEISENIILSKQELLKELNALQIALDSEAKKMDK